MPSSSLPPASKPSQCENTRRSPAPATRARSASNSSAGPSQSPRKASSSGGTGGRGDADGVEVDLQSHRRAARSARNAATRSRRTAAPRCAGRPCRARPSSSAAVRAAPPAAGGDRRDDHEAVLRRHRHARLAFRTSGRTRSAASCPSRPRRGRSPGRSGGSRRVSSAPASRSRNSRARCIPCRRASSVPCRRGRGWPRSRSRGCLFFSTPFFASNTLPCQPKWLMNSAIDLGVLRAWRDDRGALGGAVGNVAGRAGTEQLVELLLRHLQQLCDVVGHGHLLGGCPR